MTQKIRMIMDEGEIIREYNGAKYKARQLPILAELNCVDNKTMAIWLKEHGCEVSSKYLPSEQKKQKKTCINREFEKVFEEPPEDGPDNGAEQEGNRTDPDTAGEKVTPDQKAKKDAGKPRLTLVPMQILFDIAEIREYGNGKYPEGGPDNWKQVEPERYREAAFRHFLRYIDDPQRVDEESGLPLR